MLIDDPKQTVLRFNDCINSRDLAGLVDLLSDDHLFIDSVGREVRGIGAVKKAWEGFFSAFPDYRNEFSSLSSEGQDVVIVGHSTCSHPALHGPGIWTALVREGRVAEWRIRDDTPETRRELAIEPTR
jgi:ketosteroid isomerase-like protein